MCINVCGCTCTCTFYLLLMEQYNSLVGRTIQFPITFESVANKIIAKKDGWWS